MLTIELFQSGSKPVTLQHHWSDAHGHHFFSTDNAFSVTLPAEFALPREPAAPAVRTPAEVQAFRADVDANFESVLASLTADLVAAHGARDDLTADKIRGRLQVAVNYGVAPAVAANTIRRYHGLEGARPLNG